MIETTLALLFVVWRVSSWAEQRARVGRLESKLRAVSRD